MVNLVIVSHSARLGNGVAELARQMLSGNGCKLAIAAGIDDVDNPIGTDPIKVMEAIESVADTDHVLVMMDMGSALLSAETALDLLDPAIAAKVRLCAAPLVEGTLAATVSAAAGAGIDKVINDAMNALEAKRVQLGLPPQTPPSPGLASFPDDRDARSASVVIRNPNGLHVRPASRLVAALSGFDAELVLEKDGKRATPDNINQIALLQVRCNDPLTLLARGPQADAALAAFTALAAEDFGESAEIAKAKNPAPGPLLTRVEGSAVLWDLPHQLPGLQPCTDVLQEQRNLMRAIDVTLDDLNALTVMAEEKYSADIAAIFSGHHMLLDDADLYEEACRIISEKYCSASWAWDSVMTDLSKQYRQLNDSYLQARYIDIEDLRNRTLAHLAGKSVAQPAIGWPAILIADDIFPSTVLQLDAQQIKGICLRAGSDVSHSAIIAREAGIAFLCQQYDALKNIIPGDGLTLDMAQKRVIRPQAG